MAKKKLSPTAKIIILITSFLVVVDVILGMVLGITSSRDTKSVLNHKMLEIAQTAAKLVNGDDIKTLTYEDKENETPKYKNNYDILAAFKTSSEENGADLAYIYCVVRLPDDRIVFSIDPSDEPGGFLTETPLVTDAMEDALNGKPGVDPKAYTDRWGTLYSAYAPIYTSDNQVAGAIGVDVWAKWYENQIRDTALSITVIGLVTVSAAVLIALLITFNIRRRLNSVTEQMGLLEKEVDTLLLEIKVPNDENKNSLEESNEKDEMAVLKRQILKAQQEIHKYIEYSQQKAYRDTLTKINNRLAYFERVKSINEKISANQNPAVTVLVYDVNGLKDINDTYGHEYGDIALVHSAEIIKEVYGENNIYRIGGDEIVVIIDDVTEERIKELKRNFDSKLVAINKEENDLIMSLSLSCGESSFKKGDKEFLDIFRRADKAMYDNKSHYYKERGIHRES